MDKLSDYNNEIKNLEDFDFEGQTLIPSKKEQDCAYIVKISAPWCHYCQEIGPIYEKACKSLTKDDNIRVCNIEVDKDDTRESEKKLVSKVKSGEVYKLKGFPTILKYRNGDLVEEFKGPRDFNGITAFFKN